MYTPPRIHVPFPKKAGIHVSPLYQYDKTMLEEKGKEGGRESYGLSHKTKKEDIENFRLYDWILKKETGGVHTQLVDIQV